MRCLYVFCVFHIKLYLIKMNNRMLTDNTHNVPPLLPVYSYHCIHCGREANALPSVSHGQLRPQSCRWINSKQIQNATNERQPVFSPHLFLTILNPSHGKHIKKLLAKKAAIAPGCDAFHIHQVVATFQVNMVIQVSAKNCRLLFTRSSINSNGIHATKMRKVRGETGHAAHNKIPLMKARKRFCERFKINVYVKIGD